MATTPQINGFIKIPITVTLFTASVLQCFLPLQNKNTCFVDLLALTKLCANAIKDCNKAERTYFNSFFSAGRWVLAFLLVVASHDPNVANM